MQVYSKMLLVNNTGYYLFYAALRQDWLAAQLTSQSLGQLVGWRYYLKDKWVDG